VKKSDLLADLTDVMSDGVSQDSWLLSVGIYNNPWGQCQRLIPYMIRVVKFIPRAVQQLDAKVKQR